MDYKTFTINLTRYDQNLKDLTIAKEELDVILYDMTGVKGISYDKLPSSFNPSQTALKSLEMVDKYNEKLNEVEFYRKAIYSVDVIRKRLPKELWLMLRDKFIRGMTYTAVGQKYGYSSHGVWQMMKRETERYL